MWELRLYVSGHDPGQLFTIQRRTLPRRFNPIGPLRPLDKPERPSQPQHPAPAKPPCSPGSQSSGSPSPTPPAATTSPTLGDLQQLLNTGAGKPNRKLLGTLDLMFSFLNRTSPNLTADCWLCLNPEPPYYVRIGAGAQLGKDASAIRNLWAESLPDGLCMWGHKHQGLTLGDILNPGTVCTL